MYFQKASMEGGITSRYKVVESFTSGDQIILSLNNSTVDAIPIRTTTA